MPRDCALRYAPFSVVFLGIFSIMLWKMHAFDWQVFVCHGCFDSACGQILCSHAHVDCWWVCSCRRCLSWWFNSFKRFTTDCSLFVMMHWSMHRISFLCGIHAPLSIKLNHLCCHIFMRIPILYYILTSQLLVTRLHLCIRRSIKLLQQHGWRWNQPCMGWWVSSTAGGWRAAANLAGAVFDALRQLWPALVVLAAAEDIRVMDVLVVVTPIENVVFPAPPGFFSALT